MRVDLSRSAKLRGLRKTAGEQFIDGTEYAARLQERHDTLHPKPKWAKALETETVESILSKPFELGAPESTLLPDVIELQRIMDVNHQEVCTDAIISAQFHPSLDVSMVASRGSVVRFFTIDDKENPLLHQVDFAGLKPTQLRFSQDGRFVVGTGRSRFLYVYDVLEDRLERINNVPDRNEREWNHFSFSPSGEVIALHGDEGFVVLLSSKTRRWVANLKMNGKVRSSAFTPDGRYLLTAGDEHLVYVWDMATHACVRKFSDDSGNYITAMAVSPDSNYLALGSSLGVVNVYNLQSVVSASDSPKPWKTLLNLTTSISEVVFHPSSQILAIATDGCHNGLRLVHLPSGRVYANWPSTQMPVGLVKTVSFSANGSMLSVGSAEGKVRLYVLKHFRR